MKIALVCPYDYIYPGGVAAHISHLARQFCRQGHTAKIIAPASGKPPQTPNGASFISLGRPVPVPGHGSIARVSLSVWLRPRVRTLLEEEKFDVIHLHEPLAPLLPLMVLYLSRTVNVGTFHAFHRSTRLYWAWRPLLRGAFARLDGRIAVSKPAMDYVSKHFPDNYRIIPNGIDVDHFSQEAPPFPEFCDGKLNILFVGRREKRKGLKYLVAAFGRIKWQRPDVRLIVVGPGHPDPECQRIIAERGIQDVVVTGPVPFADLPRYYASAHIFCSPATGAESFGLVLLEAMAARRPVVATSIEGYASVMEDGREGLLVPPRQEEPLARALETLLNDPEARRRMGAQGWSKIQDYRWESVASQVLDCYQELLEHRPVQAAPH